MENVRRVLIIALFTAGVVTTIIVTLNINARGLHLDKGVILTTSLSLCILLFDDLRNLYRPVERTNIISKFLKSCCLLWECRGTWGDE
jgi:hypothetical protein